MFAKTLILAMAVYPIGDGPLPVPRMAAALRAVKNHAGGPGDEGELRSALKGDHRFRIGFDLAAHAGSAIA